MILSSLFFALMSVFVRMAGELPFYQKALFRNAVPMVVSACILLYRRTPIRVPKSCRIPLTGRIVFGLTAVFCNYYAIDHLPLASSNSLNKLAPFFAIFFAAVFLKEHITLSQLGCVAIALVGCCFLIFPNLTAEGFASCVALLGGITSGGAHTSLRAAQREGNIDSSVVVFLFCTFSTVVISIPCLIRWTPMTGQQILWMLLAGTSCTVAQYGMTLAYCFAAPREISIYDCSQIIFSGILGYFLFHQIPSLFSGIAYALIILASVLLFTQKRHTNTSL